MSTLIPRWRKPEDELPKKPGLKNYEQIRCLIKRNGEIEISIWNCEHICWDDDEGDDFMYQPGNIDFWMPLSDLPEAEV